MKEFIPTVTLTRRNHVYEITGTRSSVSKVANILGEEVILTAHGANATSSHCLILQQELGDSIVLITREGFKCLVENPSREY